MNEYERIRCENCGATKDILRNYIDISTTKCICGKTGTFKIIGSLGKVIYKEFVKT